MPLDLVVIEHSPQSHILEQAAAEVSFPLTTEEQNFIEEMKTMLIKLKGVGLAAPQVGVSKQIIVLHIDANAKDLRLDAHQVVPMTVLINPNYSPAPGAELRDDWEACFSVAETTGKVPRYSKIVYTAYTPEGKQFSANAEGFTARVLQHEIDHVHGILILKRLTTECLQGHPQEMMEFRIREMNTKQKATMLKMLTEYEKSLGPNDTARAQAFARARTLLSEDQDIQQDPK